MKIDTDNLKVGQKIKIFDPDKMRWVNANVTAITEKTAEITDETGQRWFDSLSNFADPEYYRS